MSNMERRKFMRLAGSLGIIIPWAGTLMSFEKLVGNGVKQNLKSRALSAFRRYEAVWDSGDFWKRGNTFDACLVFADAAHEKWPNDPEIKNMQKKVAEMSEKNLSFFNTYDPGDLWADDFGWWGLMALNARKHLLRMGNTEHADKYLKLSTDLCWEYKKNTAYDSSESAEPVPHGCRNGDANGNSKGVKNTVTNVLLFLLSSRIYRSTLAENSDDNTKYLDMAYRQWLWFEEWFELEQYQYLKEISPSAALVQERPMAFFEGSDYQTEEHPPWEKGWVWTGDQGMLLAALTDMLAIREQLGTYLANSNIDTNFDVDAFGNKLRKWIKKIGNGVKTALISDADGILREAPFTASFGPVHGNDYVAGRGILMRYLGADEVKNLLGTDFDDSLLATSDAIWQMRNSSNNQFQPVFTELENDKLYVKRFRKLWGLADDVYEWNLEKMNEKNKNGVCQSVGLDALGAAIGLL